MAKSASVTKVYLAASSFTSPAVRLSPKSSAETSTSNESTMSEGKHSTSMLRTKCSSVPPFCETPTGSPTRLTAISIVSVSVMETSWKSAWRICPLNGWCCTSFSNTFLSSTPCTSRSNITCSSRWCPIARLNERSSSWTFNGALPTPYTTPGNTPDRRMRRPALEPVAERTSAETLIAVAILYSPRPSRALTLTHTLNNDVTDWLL